MRSRFGLLGIVALLAHLTTPPALLGQAISLQESNPVPPVDSEFQARLKTVNSWASLVKTGMNWLHDEGFSLRVERALEAKSADVARLLDWVPGQGVLLEVAVQVPRVQDEFFVRKDLLGQGARVIGAGATPINVVAVYLKREAQGRGDLLPAPNADWALSPGLSRYFWVTRDKKGPLVRRYVYDSITRAGAELYANRELIDQIADAESRSLMMKMADTAVRVASKRETKEKIKKLQTDAAESMKKLDDINRQLRSELERAERLGTVADSLAKLSTVLSLTAQIATANSTLGKDTPQAILEAKSQAELNDAVDAARARNQEVIRGFQNTRTETMQGFIIQRNTIILELKNQGAPTDILPQP